LELLCAGKTVETSNLNMKLLLLLLTTALLLSSCASPDTSTNQEHSTKDELPATQLINRDTLPELSLQQQAAIDALNTLQLSTDEMNHLYSTFAGVVHPCYPPDTSLALSQSDLLRAMQQFVLEHCTSLPPEERNELAATSVLAQETYTVLLCLDHSAPISYSTGVPMSGTWVLPSVLGRRDVILVW
jgi:hypothetical protein